MPDFVREGDLVADETTADAIVGPSASSVLRAHRGQGACLRHNAVDDFGEWNNAANSRVTLRLVEKADPGGIAATGVGATVALSGGPEKSPLLVCSTPRMVVSKYGKGSIRAASAHRPSSSSSVGEVMALVAVFFQLTRTRATFGALTGIT